MKQLQKSFKAQRNTIEMYACTCTCTCLCNYCAATWEAQSQADSDRVHRNMVLTTITSSVSSKEWKNI